MTVTLCQVESELLGHSSSTPEMAILCLLTFVSHGVLRSQGTFCLDTGAADDSQQPQKAWEVWLSVCVGGGIWPEGTKMGPCGGVWE